MKFLKYIMCVIVFISANTFAEDKNKLALEYLELTNTKQLFDITIENYVNHLSLRNPKLNKEELMLFFNSYMGWDVVRDPTIKIVSDKFTEKELKNINAFFKTDDGRSLANQSPKISMEVSNLIGGNINKALASMKERAQQEK
jgi:hypothetical protein